MKEHTEIWSGLSDRERWIQQQQNNKRKKIRRASKARRDRENLKNPSPFFPYNLKKWKK